MLRFFAKFERSRSALLWVFCALLLVGLVAFYIPNSSLGPGMGAIRSSDNDTVIAKVGSQEITLKEYKGALSMALSAFGRGNSLPLGIAKSIGYDKRALDDLISERLVIDQGRELNLTGADREVADAIIRTFTNEQGNFVGRDEYLRRMKISGMAVEDYEKDRRNDITARKVREFIISPIQVSDREVEEKYKRDNTKVEVVYATVDRDKIRAKFNPTDQDLRSYFDARKDEFKAGERTRQVEYIFIPTKEVAKTVPVTEEELKKEYEARKQYEKRASIIKLNVLTAADENTVKTKIDELARKVRDAKGEDFASVAKGNSQDPSAKQGGDIGWIKKEPNKTSQWRQRVYTNELEVGAVEGPFKDGRSWYLMKVTEQREVPFDQIRDTLKATAQNNKAFKVSNDLAQKAYEKAKQYNDLRKAAEEIAGEIKVSADSMLKTTPYFNDGDEQKDLGDSAGQANNPAFDSATIAIERGQDRRKGEHPRRIRNPESRRYHRQRGRDELRAGAQPGRE